MISWHTTTSSCLSSHPHGGTHTTCPLSQNWATHPPVPPLPKPPSLLTLHLRLPLSRARNSTQSPVKPFPKKLNTCIHTCLSHAMKSGPRLPSEFSGRSHSRDHLAIHRRHHHHHQHHGASCRHLRRALRSRGDVNCFRHSRHHLHRSTLRFRFIVFFFVISFSHHCLSILMSLTHILIFHVTSQLYLRLVIPPCLLSVV